MSEINVFDLNVKFWAGRYDSILCDCVNMTHNDFVVLFINRQDCFILCRPTWEWWKQNVSHTSQDKETKFHCLKLLRLIQKQAF